MRNRACRATLAAAAALCLAGCSIDEQEINAVLATKLPGIEAASAPVEGLDFNSVKAFRRPPQGAAAAAPLRVIIVPGTPSDVTFWGGAMEKIDPQAEVVAVERPGYRGSGPHRAVTDLNEQAAMLAALIRPYNGPVLLVGHSYGASVVLAALGMYGDAVNGAVLVSPYVLPVHGGRRTWFQLIRFTPLRFIGGNVTNRFVQEVAAQRRQSADLLTVAETTCKPILIIQGDRDDLVPPGDARSLLGKFNPCTEASIEYVEGGDHYLSVHKSTEIAGLINAFLARLSSPAVN